MRLSDLKPLNQLSQRYGVKSVMYGGPGCAKTPLAATAPRPVICVCEPGLLSVRDISHVPGFLADTPAKLDDFMKWCKESSETKNFDTIAVDSITQMAEIILKQELDRNAHGLKAYGEMSRRIIEHLNMLNYLPQKHTYLICKEGLVEQEKVMTRKPYFPGRDLNIQVPHMFDEVLHIGWEQFGASPKPVLAIRTRSAYGVFARDRSGNLDEFEPPELTALFNKAMK